MSRFVIRETPLAGLAALERQPIADSRGFLERLFCQDTIGNMFQGESLRQVNRTVTVKEGSVRGLHFQYPPYSEVKVISCLKGEVWDVVVDLRKDSATFLQHHAIVLSAKNRISLVIPRGFAHGFQTLTPDCELLYCHSADYNHEAEGALNVLDPRLAIHWPKAISEISERDRATPLVKGDFPALEVS